MRKSKFCRIAITGHSGRTGRRPRAKKHQIELKFIQPGKPSQNGLIERLNKTLRTECLNLCWFQSIDELNEIIQAWSQVYNTERPHENLQNLTPEKYENQRSNFFYAAVT